MPEQTQPLVSASLSDRFEVFQMLCQAEAPVVVDGSPRSALVVADHTVPGSQQRRHRREVVRHSGAAVKDDYKIVSCSARHEDRQPGAWRIHEVDLFSFIDVAHAPLPRRSLHKYGCMMPATRARHLTSCTVAAK
jgi:hypothetical protein